MRFGGGDQVQLDRGTQRWLAVILIGLGCLNGLLVNAGGLLMLFSPSLSVSSSPIGAGILVLTSNLFLIAFFWGVWWMFVRRRQFDPAYRGTIETTPTGTRARLHVMVRMGVVWVGLITTLTFTPVICGATWRDSLDFPERHGMFPTWAVAAYCLVIGLGLTFRAWRSAVPTGYVLDDESGGTVSWAYWHPKWRERSVSRVAIVSLSVREGKLPPFGVRLYEVVMHWKLPQREPESEVVVGFSDLVDAEALADWIRGRLGLAEEPHPPVPLSMNGDGVFKTDTSLAPARAANNVRRLNTPSPFMERGTGGEVSSLHPFPPADFRTFAPVE